MALSRIKQLMLLYEADEEIFTPNKMFRGTGDRYTVADQAHVDSEFQLQSPTSSGYSYTRNSQAGPGKRYPTGKRPTFK